jgi:hypothetical protein
MTESERMLLVRLHYAIVNKRMTHEPLIEAITTYLQATQPDAPGRDGLVGYLDGVLRGVEGGE